VEFLEKQSIVNIERFKQRSKDLKSSVQKELEVATLDSAGLRRLLKMKNLELRQMKSLAATILSQRSETEQFFLEALEEVREVIRKERRRNTNDEKIILNKLKAGVSTVTSGLGVTSSANRASESLMGGALPQINVKGSNLHYFEKKSTAGSDLMNSDNVSIKFSLACAV
jgi:hypothetical protein